jgi:hypothetical protein
MQEIEEVIQTPLDFPITSGPTFSQEMLVQLISNNNKGLMKKLHLETKKQELKSSKEFQKRRERAKSARKSRKANRK